MWITPKKQLNIMSIRTGHPGRQRLVRLDRMQGTGQKIPVRKESVRYFRPLIIILNGIADNFKGLVASGSMGDLGVPVLPGHILVGEKIVLQALDHNLRHIIDVVVMAVNGIVLQMAIILSSAWLPSIIRNLR